METEKAYSLIESYMKCTRGTEIACWETEVNEAECKGCKYYTEIDREYHQFNQNIVSIIDKFKNGEERYRTSVLFNNVIQMLLRGAEPLDIIDKLITMNENTQKAFQEYARDDMRHFIINTKYPNE